MAEIYENGLNERMVICAVREALAQPFEATDWLDLRVGYFLSITDATDDDDPTVPTIEEDIGASDTEPIAWSDRVVIGITGGVSLNDYVFAGYTNAGTGRTNPSLGRSMVVSSDVGGSAGSDYWRVDNGRNDRFATQIIQNDITRANGGFGERLHFAQDIVAAGGYATLIAMRFTRPDARNRAKLITMQVAHDPTALLFNDDPSLDILQSSLEAFPTTSVHTLGPVELNRVPDQLYVYWPMHFSRIRIHAAGILKAG